MECFLVIPRIAIECASDAEIEIDFPSPVETVADRWRDNQAVIKVAKSIIKETKCFFIV